MAVAIGDCSVSDGCLACNPLIAAQCGGVWGTPCEETTPAGAPSCNGDNTGTVTPPHQGQGHLAGADERPPSQISSTAQVNQRAPTHSPPRYDWHDCISPVPACGVSREDAMSTYQLAVFRECHQGLGHD